MGKTKIIVEGELDKMFIEAIIEKHHKDNTRVIDALLKAGDPTKKDGKERRLTDAISGLRPWIFPSDELIDEPVDRVAIIRDWDNYTKSDRLSTVRDAIKNSTLGVKNANSLTVQSPLSVDIEYSRKKRKVEFSCFFVGVIDKNTKHLKGETDNLLQAIKSKPSPVADCALECLEKCLKS